MRPLACALAILLLPVSLSAQSRARAAICVPAQIDSMRLKSTTVYRNCDVDVAARRRSAARPSFLFPRELSCGIVELEFVVGADGIPIDSSALVLSTNSTEFAVAVVRSLSRWRYRPAQLNGTPVAQLVRERYTLSSGRVPFVVSSQPAPPRPSPAVKCE